LELAKRDSNTSSLEDAIERLLKVYKLSDKMVELDVIEAWGEVMGPVIAGKTIEIRVVKKVIHVKLDSSTLREELSYGKSQIVENLNSHLGIDYLKGVLLK
jgi:hypothetical protein